MKYAAFAIVALAMAVFANAGAGGVDNVVWAQTPALAPQNVAVVDGDNPREAIVSWDAVAAARYYRVGWVPIDAYVEVTRAGWPWTEAFFFVEVANRGQSSYTVKGLKPGMGHIFIVAGKASEHGEPQFDIASVVWLTLRATEQPDCPVRPPTFPDSPVDGDYDADDDGLIEVRDVAQLDAIRYDLHGSGSSAAAAYAAAFPGAAAWMGCPAAGCAGYELANDLDFGTAAGGPGWQPIGDNSNYPTSTFTTTFDGNGHTIANLYIDRDDTPHAGLFGNTGPGSVIRDVGLVSVSVSNSGVTGGLVGESGSLIERSHVTGTVESADVDAAWQTGGLVGINHGTITDSYTTATVSGSGDVGGLVGMNFEVIADSHATGAVSGGDNVSVGATVGGLVGTNLHGGGISHSHAAGNVSSAGPGAAGGLVGINYGDVTAGYATGSVSESYVGGGLVGSNRYWATIAASYATGSVSVRDFPGYVGAGGGLAGGNTGAITASYATGSVTVRGNLHSSGGNHYHAGGLVGSNGHAGSNHQGRIAASYATGRVTGIGDGVIVGGLVGDNSLGDITASYWNTETSGQSDSSGGAGLTTAELQSPRLAKGIYATWNLAWWDFGTSWQYPVLKYLGMEVAAQR